MEVDLGMSRTWPLIIDEALRLLVRNQDSLLTLRFKESHHLTIFKFAFFIRSRRDFQILNFEQNRTLDGVFVFKLGLRRLSSLPALDTFDFGIISNGDRPEHLRLFIDSVRADMVDESTVYKIIICGPKSLIASQVDEAPDILVIDSPKQFADKGWITRKKNLIVSAATSENLMVVHDRYKVSRGFFSALKEYGADFSVLVPRQITKDGQRFPDWVTLGSTWSWLQPSFMKDDDFDDDMYVNGGAVIAKTEVLIHCPWNELLLWNQGEDVEFTRHMRTLGVVPRLAPYVVLETVEPREGYTRGFLTPIETANNVSQGFPRSLKLNPITRLARVFVSSKTLKRLLGLRFSRYVLQTTFGKKIRKVIYRKIEVFEG
jgi:hypothetical protein